MGYYIDYASGIHFFRNISYSNGLAGFMASGSWMDQSVVLANNTIADSPVGYTMGVRNAFSDAAVGLDVLNTIFLHLRRFAFSFGDERIVEGNASLDHDLFHLCGYEDWPSHTPGIMAGHVDSSGYRELPALEDVRTLGFEASGLSTDPLLADYDPGITDGSWQDFGLTPESPAVDSGSALPPSLVTLLERFAMDSGQSGGALDRGAIELGSTLEIDVGPTDGTGPVTPPWDPDDTDPVDPHPDEPSRGCGCSIVS